jgi:hypothetical protein
MLSQLQARSPLILVVTRYEHRLRGSVEQFKALAQLMDGSQLRLNEVWLDNQLHKYAYYWLTPTDEVIQGWDNAPHHPEVSTFPHHSHTPSAIQSSQVRSLADVLDLIEQRIKS